MDRRLCATTRCPQSVTVFFEDHRLKNRLIFASGFEREDDAALGAVVKAISKSECCNRTPPGRIAL
jgi:hypothetical protein